MIYEMKIKLTNLLILCLTSLMTILPASATVDFSALTDLINATFDVLDTIVTNSSTLISVIVLFGTLGLIGIIIYGFIGRLLMKLGNWGTGGK